MVNIFIVGGTGHIGGAVLDAVYSAHPEVNITALVRDEQKGTDILTKWPRVKSVIGDLSTLEVLEKEASRADIVINTAPDVSHEDAISTILRGLGQENRPSKGFYIHTSGAARIWDEPDGSKAGTKIWDDVKDIDTILAIPDTATHSITDKLVFSSFPTIHTAIISPVGVYGLSPSLHHPLPLTLPDILAAILSLNQGFTISHGHNILDWIHVRDLARIYLLLTSSAIAQLSSTPDPDPDPAPAPALFGPSAYFFGSAIEIPFVEYMATVTSILHEAGVLPSPTQIVQIDVGKAAQATGASDGIPPPDSWATHIAMMFGVDMRVVAVRARGAGWVAREEGLCEGGEFGVCVRRWLEENGKGRGY